MKFDKDQLATIMSTYNDVIEEDYEQRTAAVENLAYLFRTTVPTIRGVLVSEGVYIKKPTATSNKDKGEIVSAFEALMGVKMPSMNNMSKKDLQAFWERFIAMSEARNVSEGK